MKRVLKVGNIANELEESKFFSQKREQKKSKKKRSGERTNGRSRERKNTRTRERTKKRTGERVIKRHSFNFYEDQLEKIQWLDLKKKMRGEASFSMSTLVRDALDAWLKKLKTKGEFDDYPNG